MIQDDTHPAETPSRGSVRMMEEHQVPVRIRWPLVLSSSVLAPVLGLAWIVACLNYQIGEWLAYAVFWRHAYLSRGPGWIDGAFRASNAFRRNVYSLARIIPAHVRDCVQFMEGSLK
jgi:hypothetical protein